MTYMYRRPSNVRDHRAFVGPQVLGDIVALGITIPKELTQACDIADALEARRRSVTSSAAIRRQTVDALIADPDANLTEHIAAELAADVEVNALVQAVDTARKQATVLVEQNSDTLCRAIGKHLFDPAHEVLAGAAQLGPQDTAISLLRDGNTGAAKVLADVPAAFENLSMAYKLRRAIYRGSHIDEMVCARWRNPDNVTLIIGEHTPTDRLIDGIRSGGGLWFGTFAEVDDLSRQHKADKDAAAKASIDQYVGNRRRRPGPDVANDSITRAGHIVQIQPGEPLDAA